MIDGMDLEDEPEFIALCKFLEKFDKDSVRRVFEKMSEKGKYQLAAAEPDGYFIIESAFAAEYEDWMDDCEIDHWDEDSRPPFIRGYIDNPGDFKFPDYVV